MQTQPQQEHAWLEKLVGDWTFEVDTGMGPGQPSAKSQGQESVRSLGGLWVVCEGQGELPGGGVANTMMTLGYDPRKERYVGAWIGSMMANLWVYEGALDATGNVLTLETEGPSFTDAAKLARYRDVVEFKTRDVRLLKSFALDDAGQWRQFMTAEYRRRQ